MKSPLTLNAPQPPPEAAPAAPVRTLTEADLAYLRWLIQLDIALQRIVAEQAHALPDPVTRQDQTRLRAILRSWEDSRREAAEFRTKASMAVSYTVRLQAIQAQFQGYPPPSNCVNIAAGYGRVLAGFANASQFSTRVYQQSALLIENPRAATHMVPPDLQDGGVAAEGQLQNALQAAKDSTNSALAGLPRQFPDQVPADVAAFRLR
jgi:hypothetical protein